MGKTHTVSGVLAAVAAALKEVERAIRMAQDIGAEVPLQPQSVGRLILSAVAAECGVTVNAILGPSHRPNVGRAKFFAALMLQSTLQLSAREVGEAMRCSHAAALYRLQRGRDLIRLYESERMIYERCAAAVGAALKPRDVSASKDAHHEE